MLLLSFLVPCLSASAYSIYEDVRFLGHVTDPSLIYQLLAKPHYDLQFSSKVITETEAQQLRTSTQTVIKYRVLNDGKDKFLCGVPNVTVSLDVPSQEERLRIEQDEKSEAARASVRGWELLNGLEGACLYWISGWWSYEYCYSEGVKQFHALSPQPGVALFPPTEDPSTGSYILGRRPKSLAKAPDAAKNTDHLPAKFRNNGASRSLVVDFQQGTYCPLISAERQIEIQFQCSPATNDRIAWVKETSSCQYLMVVQTARLCHDVAFQEAAIEPSNTIMCTMIGESNTYLALDATSQATEEKAAQATDAARDTGSDAVNDTPDLAHLAFEEPPDLLSLPQWKARAEVIPDEKDKARVVSNLNHADETHSAKHEIIMNMAHDIAEQLVDGSLTVGGKSIFDPDNENSWYNVELQDQSGGYLGTVTMSVVDGAVVVELGDVKLSDIDTSPDGIIVSDHANDVKIPDALKKVFNDFVGHEEL